MSIIAESWSRWTREGSQDRIKVGAQELMRKGFVEKWDVKN